MGPWRHLRRRTWPAGTLALARFDLPPRILKPIDDRGASAGSRPAAAWADADGSPRPARTGRTVDRERSFAACGVVRVLGRGAGRRPAGTPVALVDHDTQRHVAVVDLANGAFCAGSRRFLILAVAESVGGTTARRATAGAVAGRRSDVARSSRVLRVVPRATLHGCAPGGRYAFVTDSVAAMVALDVLRGGRFVASR